MNSNGTRDLGFLLLLAGVAAENLLDDMPDELLVLILLLAALVFVGPHLIAAWRSLKGWVNRKLHPPIVRVADTAGFSQVRPLVLTTHPFGHAASAANVVLAVFDEQRRRLDGVKVTFQTNNGLLRANDAVPLSGKSIVTYTDTDTQQDFEFLTYNPGHSEAGTAEVMLDCSAGAGAIAGDCDLTVAVERPGAAIVLTTKITVLGPPTATGLTLSLLPPDRIARGEVVIVEGSVVDAAGAPVADGTPVFFAVNGGTLVGQLDSQGGRPTVGGKAYMLWLTDREEFGEFRVVATTGGIDNLAQSVSEAMTVQVYETFNDPNAPYRRRAHTS